MLAVVTPDINHPILSTRSGADRQFYAQFPGEHYHLLTAICGLLKPAIVWEFGTDTGMSTVAMLEGLGPELKLYTVDIDGWRSKTGPWLVERDIGSGRVTQLVCDMKCETLFTDHLESISQAELIFVDGPKDGSTEGAFLLLLEQVSFRQNPIVIFDDIRLINMVGIWRGIQRPKMDMTSYGHWSGTGLVDWLPSSSQSSLSSNVISDTKTAKKSGSTVVSSSEIKSILVLCHQKPNYIPDLLLHGLRKLLGVAVVDYPRKNALYDGCLGQPYLDPIPDLMSPDADVDRSEIQAKIRSGFFDLVLCDIRAINDNRELLRDGNCPLGLIDGEDRPADLKSGNYVILRRETDGSDLSVPLQMAMPVEVLDWIDRHAQTPKAHSIAFLGSRSGLTPDRNAIVDELCRIFPDALIGAWSIASGQWQGRDAYYRAMQSCKVVLNLPGAGFDTFRYWENASCNAAHVAKRMPIFIPDDFRDDREIVRFSDIRELVNAVERILFDTIDWRDLAAQSRKWLRLHHTTERRAATTLFGVKSAFSH